MSTRCKKDVYEEFSGTQFFDKEEMFEEKTFIVPFPPLLQDVAL